MNDELRDYRFYLEGMLYLTDQAVEYIWQRLQQTCFNPATLRWLDEWKLVREALKHRPFNPDSPDYNAFVEKTQKKMEEMKARYPDLSIAIFRCATPRASFLVGLCLLWHQPRR